MAERTIAPATYTVVCALLVLLTITTVAVSFVPMQPGVWHIVVGLTIGLVKASLVVLFFMHALLSDRVTWIVIAISIFWLLLLLVLTFCDYFTRDMVPLMPGH
jgi:cytochrome c oxidase subunit IV